MFTLFTRQFCYLLTWIVLLVQLVHGIPLADKVSMPVQLTTVVVPCLQMSIGFTYLYLSCIEVFLPCVFFNVLNSGVINLVLLCG